MAQAVNRIPLAAKTAYTMFVALLAPYYLKEYGPTNFLYFCDVALALTLLSVWSEKPLFVSAAVVGILLPQSLWMADFIGSLFGLPITGMTAYMFDGRIPPFTRFLSFYHFWLPLFALWCVHRLGYDKRAFRFWSVIAVALLIVCYLFMPPPPAPVDNPSLPVNINYVFGPSDKEAQTWLHPHLYFGLYTLFLVFAVFLPTHLLLKRFYKDKTNIICAR